MAGERPGGHRALKAAHGARWDTRGPSQPGRGLGGAPGGTQPGAGGANRGAISHVKEARPKGPRAESRTLGCGKATERSAGSAGGQGGGGRLRSDPGRAGGLGAQLQEELQEELNTRLLGHLLSPRRSGPRPEA